MRYGERSATIKTKFKFVGQILWVAFAVGSVALCLSATPRQEATAPVASGGGVSVQGGAATAVDSRGFVGDEGCRSCHAREFEGYMGTRHRLDSQLPTKDSIHGHFDAGRNTMESLDPAVRFRMEARAGAKGEAFFETAIEGSKGHEKTRTEQIGLVVGSGRKGQTYLYWRGDELFELPVSYWTSLDRWVNSPGYVDGTADFDRGINPRCLECHSTYFQVIQKPQPGFHYDRANFTLGISCERCHGAGAEHVRMHTAGGTGGNGSVGAESGAGANGVTLKMPPVGIERDRQIDVCAQCHGGIGSSLTPAFTYKPGATLSSYISLESDPLARVDVHGNQVALLEKSRCFQSSPNMTCSTCHELHSAEREAASYSEKCLTCHQATACPTFSKMPHQDTANCVDCHMPLQSSTSLAIDTNDERVAVRVRNHWIRVYPSAGAEHQKH